MAAFGPFVFSGTTTAPGSVSMFMGGRPISASIITGQTAAQVATTCAAAINADPRVGVSAVGNAANLDLTFKSKGEVGNDFRAFINFDGEILPANLTVGSTDLKLAGGTTNPDNAPLIGILGDEQYNVIVQPFKDASNRALWKSELENRFLPEVATEGQQISVDDDTLGNLSTLGDGLNSEFLEHPNYSQGYHPK